MRDLISEYEKKSKIEIEKTKKKLLKRQANDILEVEGKNLLEEDPTSEYETGSDSEVETLGGINRLRKAPSGALKRERELVIEGSSLYNQKQICQDGQTYFQVYLRLKMVAR